MSSHGSLLPCLLERLRLACSMACIPSKYCMFKGDHVSRLCCFSMAFYCCCSNPPMLRDLLICQAPPFDRYQQHSFPKPQCVFVILDTSSLLGASIAPNPQRNALTFNPTPLRALTHQSPHHSLTIVPLSHLPPTPHPDHFPLLLPPGRAEQGVPP